MMVVVRRSTYCGRANILSLAARGSFCTGVHVFDAGDVAAPFADGETTLGEGTGSLERVIAEFVEVGEIPQMHGAIAGSGGQGAPGRAERHRGDQVGACRNRFAEAVSPVRVGEVPQR